MSTVQGADEPRRMIHQCRVPALSRARSDDEGEPSASLHRRWPTRGEHADRCGPLPIIMTAAIGRSYGCHSIRTERAVCPDMAVAGAVALMTFGLARSHRKLVASGHLHGGVLDARHGYRLRAASEAGERQGHQERDYEGAQQFRSLRPNHPLESNTLPKSALQASTRRHENIVIMNFGKKIMDL